MKLWWPHDELLIASMMLYRDLGDDKYLAIFDKRWITAKRCSATLNGRVVRLPAAGRQAHRAPLQRASTFKGPFHLPRMLVMVDQTISQILAR